MSPTVPISVLLMELVCGSLRAVNDPPGGRGSCLVDAVGPLAGGLLDC